MKDIILLNGEKVLRDPFIKRMENDNFYYGDLKFLALSSTSIKLLLESPKKFYYVTKYGSKESQAMRDGRLLHTLVLEPDKFDNLEFVDVASKNTKKYKEAYKENPEVYTQKEKQDAERLADALLRNDKAMQLIRNKEYEIPIINYIKSADGEDFAFRGKADLLGSKIICDIKTTSDLSNFNYSAKKYGYDIQCYIYCELFDRSFEDFYFLILDKASLDVGEAMCSEEFYLSGQQKVWRAIEVYKEYFQGKDLVNDDFSQQLDNYYIRKIL